MIVKVCYYFGCLIAVMVSAGLTAVLGVIILGKIADDRARGRD